MKTKLFFIVLLVFAGIWMGINIAKGRPLYSNPFADGDLRQRASGAAANIVEQTREAIERKLKTD